MGFRHLKISSHKCLSLGLVLTVEPSVNKMFDVFLSFRGPDTRQGFARSLYAALDRERIWAFLDEESLEKGDHIPTGLNRGIKESRICIPIFSKKFAESKWCLREVLIMVQSGVKIFPVFYGVSPVDLHCLDESIYAEDIKKHESEPILEFKGALHAVSNIPGWCSSDFSGNNDLIQDIVVGIGKILHHNSPLKVLDVPVCFGLDRSVDQVKGLLKTTSDHRQKIVKLGIHGMSGIGKTTLAKVICKQLNSGFEKFAFVLSVGERCKEADGLVNVQTQMLKDVSRFKGEVGYVDQGKCLLQECLRGKRVLILLDDIQTPEQFDALGGNFSQFGAGSHLIITTQNEQILKVGSVDKLHKVRNLHPQYALRLFKFHAFPNSSCSDQELETLCNDIVAACEGLPLALQILGKHLYGKEDRNVWKEMVGKLRREKNMQKKLRVPYDALDRHEKEMFQDIACFMTWGKNEMAMNFWEEFFPSPRACLTSLLQKSLVELGPSKILLMHGCLRDLGRSIADEMNTLPRKRRRLFNEDDVGYVLGRPWEKAKHVRYLSYEPREAMTLSAEIFKSMYNLRLLWLTNVAIEGHFPEEASLEDLKWLRLTRYSSKRLPQGMSLHNLVILEVTNSQITHLWDETDENPTLSYVKLKVLILRGCGSLQSLPGTLCHSPLQKLDLHNCHSLISLPDSIRNWTSLVSLDMKGCSVSSLPQDFGYLINLKELNLSCCRNLSKLPLTLGIWVS